MVSKTIPYMTMSVYVNCLLSFLFTGHHINLTNVMLVLKKVRNFSGVLKAMKIPDEVVLKGEEEYYWRSVRFVARNEAVMGRTGKSS